MRAYLATLAVLLPLLSLPSHAATPESLCIAMAELADAVTDFKQLGEAVESTTKIIDKNFNSHSSIRAIKAAHNIISYVYIMDLDKKNAMKLVYLKCMAGQYD